MSTQINYTERTTMAKKPGYPGSLRRKQPLDVGRFYQAFPCLVMLVLKIGFKPDLRTH